ncbi:MAG: hypothetical protein KDD89_06480 [Anaerolineales bacterium]|nr:hypothetical protein [Anaerolineales bacterium]
MVFVLVMVWSRPWVCLPTAVGVVKLFLNDVPAVGLSAGAVGEVAEVEVH